MDIYLFCFPSFASLIMTLTFAFASVVDIRERQQYYLTMVVWVPNVFRLLTNVYTSWPYFLRLQVIPNRRTPSRKSWRVFLAHSLDAPAWLALLLKIFVDFSFLRIGMGGLRSIKMDAIFLDRTEFINVAALWGYPTRPLTHTLVNWELFFMQLVGRGNGIGGSTWETQLRTSRLKIIFAWSVWNSFKRVYSRNKRPHSLLTNLIGWFPILNDPWSRLLLAQLIVLFWLGIKRTSRRCF